MNSSHAAGLPARLVLAAAAAFLTVCVLELGARAHYFASFGSEPKQIVSGNPPRGRSVTLGEILRPSPYPRIMLEMKPDLDVLFTGVRLRTNAKGWREKEATSPRNEDTFRIVGIGDSFMFGWAVEESERYMDLLESRLNRDGGRRFETFVFAAPSYNLAMEVEVLRRYAMDVDPDLIVYGFYENDYCLPNFLAPRKSFFSRELFLASYLAGTMSRLSSPLVSRDDALHGAFETFEASYCTPANVQSEYRDLVGRESFTTSLVELRDLGRSRGVPVVFLGHQPCHRFDGRPVPEGIHYIDLETEYAEELRGTGDENLERSGLVIAEADPHPSRRGHELIADVLFRELRSRNLLGKRRTPASTERHDAGEVLDVGQP